MLHVGSRKSARSAPRAAALSSSKSCLSSSKTRRLARTGRCHGGGEHTSTRLGSPRAAEAPGCCRTRCFHTPGTPKAQGPSPRSRSGRRRGTARSAKVGWARLVQSPGPRVQERRGHQRRLASNQRRQGQEEEQGSGNLVGPALRGNPSPRNSSRVVPRPALSAPVHSAGTAGSAANLHCFVLEEIKQAEK